ncbi:hypothetical protein CRUP_016195 [Coryphaenoides rupestris]|nr:hypothetical protein CRUP_016195 [Coryphaenoides rupestris]
MSTQSRLLSGCQPVTRSLISRIHPPHTPAPPPPRPPRPPPHLVHRFWVLGSVKPPVWNLLETQRNPGRINALGLWEDDSGQRQDDCQRAQSTEPSAHIPASASDEEEERVFPIPSSPSSPSSASSASASG